MRTTLMLALVAAPALVASAPGASAPRILAAQQHLSARVWELGLDRDHEFALKNVVEEGTSESHVRFNQLYKGVRVFEGEVIVHSREGQVEGLTDALARGLRLDVTPTVEASEALAAAHKALAPKGAYASEPTTELVVARVDVPVTLRNGQEFTVQRAVLAYHVHAELENGDGETSHTDFLVSAHTGAILDRWSTLHTAAATGTGKSQYSGTVSINTNSVSGGYELRDTVRGMNYATYNLNHATSGTGTIYTDADNTWGDGANYVEGSSTTAANGQTAGVDAHYGVGKTYDYYKNVLGRNGIDGAGRATYSRVHYSNSYDNAFWSDSCFCMTYGDGSSFKTLTALDVAGHEMSHGVCARTANLTYRGESGGLNEANSDINGTMVEFYARGGSGSTIGNSGGNWTIGEQLASTPLRYMYKPSLDGGSRDAWSSTLKNLDVHYSSGPANRMFYFLSQGASSSPSSNYYSSYLPGGMTGIGNDKAARIWFKALTSYMTSSTTYAGAKTACLNACVALGYPSGSTEYNAVVNAFKAINR
ncbi:MAG: M4 family metallopeptidase [Holophagaceae bacterium]